MMTITGKIMFALHGLILIFTVRAGSIAATDGTGDLAAVLYLLAVVNLIAILREIGRAELHEAGRPAPYWVCWLKARSASSAINECCRPYIETVGLRHDELCHLYSRSYLDEEEPGR